MIMEVAARLISTSNLPVHLKKSQFTVDRQVEALNKASKRNMPEREFRYHEMKDAGFSKTL